MSLLAIKQEIRQKTIDVLSVLPELSSYTIYNAPLSSIPMENAPFISVFLQSETGSSSANINQAYQTTFELILQIVYTEPAVNGHVSTWADAIEEIETVIQEALFENADWLDNFVDVPSYSISRDVDSDGNEFMSISTMSIIVEQFITYEANRPTVE